MKTITEKYRLNAYSSRLFDMYFHGQKLCVFDIETTGLYPRNDKLILSGLITVDHNTASVIQYLAENPGQEAEVIRATCDVLADADLVITYNGRSFDIPFLQTRAKKHKIKTPDHYPELDLYMVLRYYSDLRSSIGSLSQKSIEKFMGFATSRDDEIDGGESVKLYDKYAVSGSEELEQTILLHNHDDIMQLYRILPVIEKSDFHAAMFKLGYPVVTEAGQSAFVQDCQIKKDGLHIHAWGENFCDYIGFPSESQPYQVNVSAAKGQLEIIIPSLEPAKGVQVIDAEGCLGSVPEELDCFPSLESGYLLLKGRGKLDHAAVNTFIIRMVRKLLPEIVENSLL